MRWGKWKSAPLSNAGTISANRCGSHCRGFTLLEVIIALGVVAVGILAVSRAVSGYVETTYTLEQRMVANWVAANRLEMLRIQKIVAEPGSSKGVEVMAGRTWHFRETITKTADPYLFRIDIVVYADKDETDEVGFLHGYLLNEPTLTPAPAQSGLRDQTLFDTSVAAQRTDNIVGANLFAHHSWLTRSANKFVPIIAEIASSPAPHDRRKCPWCNDVSLGLSRVPRNDELFLSRAIKGVPDKRPAVIARNAVTKQSRKPGLSVMRLPRFARNDEMFLSRAIVDVPDKLPAVIAPRAFPTVTRNAVTKQSFKPGLSVMRLPRFARNDKSISLLQAPPNGLLLVNTDEA